MPFRDFTLLVPEDGAVKRCLGTMRLEGAVQRENVTRVDALSDPLLFDLKLLHNGC